jgi:glycosyltransferase involved in cell wall biosynthesis
MDKTNVVLLTDCLGDITGGAEKQIIEVAKRLPKDRCNVFIASMEAQGETSGPLIASIGCQLRIFRVKRIYGLSGLIQGLQFFSFLRKNSIDALMTYHFGSDIWGASWGHLAGVALIISNRRDMGFWRNRSHVLSYRMVNAWVNTIVTVTESIKQLVLQTERISADKVNVIYNGVESAQYPSDAQKKREELGLNPKDIVIMHVANLRPVKGHKYLIEAFTQASQRFAGIKLVLIGKDELNGQMQNLAQTLGIKDKILFLGQRTDVDQLLPVADICVLPSLSEGMSNAILEYMASSKPVIATNVGGNPELIQNGYNGLLVDKENTKQLADALMDLLASKEKRLALGANGLKVIKEKFSMQAMMDNYQKVLGL